MPLSDRLIKERALEYGMITPFIEHQVKEVNGQGVVSYGLSSYGYDIRVDTIFKVFTPTFMPIVDPKNFDSRCFVDVEVKPHDAIIIPPNSFALAQSMETFNIPRDILALCVGKSTMARLGIIVNITPSEPMWKGVLTIEISNTTPLPAKVYACEGIAQMIFFQADEVCEVSYADKKGKYQNQQGIVVAKV